jgi:polyhydroxyalkanoate synthesis repressor PhaR
MPTRRRAAVPESTADRPDGDAPPPAEEGAKTGASSAPAAGPRVLKKYPNRRLYDTAASAYITLADVKAMVLRHDDFVVRDAKTGEDLTRAILLQIILEEETGGEPIFSQQMLANLIRFYGHAMQGMMGAYMEKNLQAFIDFQQRLAEQATGLAGQQALPAELWAQFVGNQAPMMQNLMGNYLEQSQHLFAQVQEQMAKQAGALFPGMPGFPPSKR